MNFSGSGSERFATAACDYKRQSCTRESRREDFHSLELLFFLATPMACASEFTVDTLRAEGMWRRRTARLGLCLLAYRQRQLLVGVG